MHGLCCAYRKKSIKNFHCLTPLGQIARERTRAHKHALLAPHTHTQPNDLHTFSGAAATTTRARLIRNQFKILNQIQILRVLS